MARVRLIEKDGVTDKVVLRTYESIEKQRGRVTNFFKAVAHRPEILRTIGPLMGAVMGTGELDHKLKEKMP